MTVDDIPRVILVTGGAGFIGSNFLRHMVTRYHHHHFICVDKLNYASSHSTTNIDPIMSVANFEFHHLDLRDNAKLTPLIARATDVFHFAAESCVDRSFYNPTQFIENNVLATQSLLEAIRTVNQLCRLVHVSTDEVYGDERSSTSSLNPTNPYSASKAAADVIVNAYHYSYGINVIIVRSNNVYGPNQYPEKLIPVSLTHLLRGEPVPIHGDGSHRRCYLHVDDYICAIKLIWSTFFQEQRQQIYNIGSGEEFTNLQVVATIADVLGVEFDVTHEEDRLYNDKSYTMDSSALRGLGWVPQTTFKEGIRQLVQEFE